jgi:hypothetical protein
MQRRALVGDQASHNASVLDRSFPNGMGIAETKR